MDDIKRQYYFEMKKRGRLLHLSTEDGRNGILTYFIGNGKPEKYQKRDMWTVVDDDSNGDTIYCDQLITDHNKLNAYIGLSMWREIKRYFKSKYPNIDKIRWIRIKRHNKKEDSNG